jgi:hypothetical protein
LIDFLTCAFSPEWTPSYVALCKILMTRSLLDQVIDLLSDVVLLSMLEFHASQFVIDPLNDNLSGLVELLPTLLFALLAAVLNKLHKLFLLKFARELALRINLVVLLFPMVALVTLKDMLDYLFSSSTTYRALASHTCWHKLFLFLCRCLMLLMVLIFFVVFVLFQYLRVK